MTSEDDTSHGDATTEVSRARRVRFVTAACLSIALAIVLYAALRVGQVLVVREPDPATALYDAHVGYFWRILTAGYGAGLLAPICFFVVEAAPLRAARAVAPAMALSASVLLLRSIFAP